MRDAIVYFFGSAFAAAYLVEDLILLIVSFFVSLSYLIPRLFLKLQSY